MALPILPKSQHVYKSDAIPGGSITFTPFTVGQQSIMLAVKDSKDPKEKLNAIKQIVNDCIVTKNIDISTLPVFVIELLFMKMRQHSIGEKLQFRYVCKATPLMADITCDNTIEVEVDLRDVDTKKYPEHNLTVQLTDTIGIKFKYPTMQTAEEIGENTDEIELLVKCADMIWEGENVTHAKDCTEEQLRDFFKELDFSQQAKIYKTFVASMPHIYMEKTVKCDKCGTEHTIKFTELMDFFQ